MLSAWVHDSCDVYHIPYFALAVFPEYYKVFRIEKKQLDPSLEKNKKQGLKKFRFYWFAFMFFFFFLSITNFEIPRAIPKVSKVPTTIAIIPPNEPNDSPSE